MLSCEQFYTILVKHDVQFYTGVPDSLLKDFCGWVVSHVDSSRHVIAANEGNAIAIASGHYLATGKPALVYMQNAGVGNAVNPLLSLADPAVYSIPMLLLIGWRGEPGRMDEPQHISQGRATLPMLELLGIPYEVLPDTLEGAEQSTERAKRSMQERAAPYALVVRDRLFSAEGASISDNKQNDTYPLTREDALRLVVELLSPQDIVVAATGKASRELFELREEKREGHEKDFLTVGSMGHASSIALGIALAKPERTIYCFDGDAALIMHMGALAVIGNASPKNFKHIVFNNFSHDSVGGQPTAARVMDMPALAKASGYREAYSASTREEVLSGMKKLQGASGPALLEIKVRRGARKNLGRPTRSPKENKTDFMRFIS